MEKNNLVLQQINISLLSSPTDYNCDQSAMIVETSWFNSYNNLEQNKFYLKGMPAEVVFSMVKQLIEGEDKDE